jgi:hypothetical protein
MRQSVNNLIDKNQIRSNLESDFLGLKLKRLWLANLILIVVLLLVGTFFNEKIYVLFLVFNFFLILIVGFMLSVANKKIDILFKLYKNDHED